MLGAQVRQRTHIDDGGGVNADGDGSCFIYHSRVGGGVGEDLNSGHSNCLVLEY